MKRSFYVCVFLMMGCLSGFAQNTPKVQLDSALNLMKENNYKDAKTLLLSAVDSYEKVSIQ